MAAFSLADIIVEPLKPKGSWWKAVCDSGRDENDRSELKRYLVPWRDMITSFNKHPELRDQVVVQI